MIKRLLIWTMIFIMSLNLSIVAFGQAKTKRSKVVEAVKSEQKIPYSIDIGDDSGAKGITVILAVNNITTFKCPTPYLNIYPGNENCGLGIKEGLRDKPTFYLTPTIPGVSTNLTVEFEDGPITFFIKVIDKQNAFLGDFNGEVNIRPVSNQKLKYEQEFEKYRSGVTTELTNLKNKVADVQIKSDERVRSDRDTMELEVLKAVENIFSTISINESKAFTDGGNGRFRVWQIGKATKVGNNWLILFKIENRGKTEIAVDDIQVKDAKVKLRKNSTRKISAKNSGAIAILITPDTQSGSSIIPSSISLTIDGISIAVKFDA